MSSTEQQAGTEGNPPAGSPPSPAGDGAGVATQAQLDAAESRRRDLQSQLDKERAEVARLKAAEAARAEQQPPASGGLTEEAVARIVTERVQSALSQREQVNAVAARYPDVDVARLGTFESVDALEAAAATAQERENARKGEIEKRIEADVLERYRAKYGALPSPAPVTGESGTQPKLTAEQVASMTMAEQLEAGITDEDLAKLSRGEAL